jgi:hypothetical protein
VNVNNESHSSKTKEMTSEQYEELRKRALKYIQKDQIRKIKRSQKKIANKHLETISVGSTVLVQSGYQKKKKEAWKWEALASVVEVLNNGFNLRLQWKTPGLSGEKTGSISKRLYTRGYRNQRF